ncbi:MAG: hypothetical protein K2Y23_06625 [Cyanobacteria bacterium]|nr:hypothetical protein [Cyanobacteriota bacterium]
MTRRTISYAAAGLLLSSALLMGAHPGHEYHIEGTVTKMRAPHFEVKDAKGNTESFMIVPGTEVSVNNSRATAADIAVGVQAEVDGVENDRGIVEAKKVRLTR